MSELQDLESYKRLIKLLNLFEKVKQISWNIMQTRNRYPAPESMTKEEMNSLFKFYLALGFDLESITEEWKAYYEEYESLESKK